MATGSDLGNALPSHSEAALLEAVRGAGPERAAALTELARRGSAEASTAFAAVLRDASASADLRATAASALGSRPGPASVRALVEALKADPPVVRRAVESLGRIGGPDALPMLRAVRPPRDRAARRALAFARSLLSYRLGLGAELISVSHESAAGGPSVRLKVSPIGKKTARAAANCLSEELPALPVDLEGAAELAGGGEHLLLLPHARASQAAASNFVPMVVLRRISGRESFALHLYILSHPLEEGRLALFGIRPDGTTTHSGEARSDGDDSGIQFRLSPLETVYRPRLSIAGHLRPAPQRIEVARAALRTGPPQQQAGTAERISAPAR